MAKNQKSYTPEFKQQIVDLYNAGGTSYPQLEREYGVNRSTLFYYEGKRDKKPLSFPTRMRGAFCLENTFSHQR